MAKWSWQVKGILVLITILIGFFLDVGWKEISSGYKKNFLLPPHEMGQLRPFPHFSDTSSFDSLSSFKEIEEEGYQLVISQSGWLNLLTTQDNNSVIESKSLKGPISFSENPLIRIRTNRTCKSSNHLFESFLGSKGRSLLHPIISLQSWRDNPIFFYNNVKTELHYELRKFVSSLIWPLPDKIFAVLNGINWNSSVYFSRSIFPTSYEDDTLPQNPESTSVQDTLRQFGVESVSYFALLQILQIPDVENSCQVVVLFHSAGLFPHPVVQFYYYTDSVAKNILEFISSL